MAEVYRARDTRLDRTVAIKVLPGHLSDDPEARQRFEREAKSISSLNNTNVCTLHDVGNHDGIDFLVMEFLEGETLADRLRRGPLPGDQVLKIGAEVCDGLDKVHRCGVIHRDLKPGNIMLTRSGAQREEAACHRAGAVSPGTNRSVPALARRPLAGLQLNRVGTRGNHFPSGAGRWQISQTGGTFPTWRGDNEEIYFIGLDGALHAATVNTKSEEFELDQVRSRFAVSYVAPVGNHYDVKPDGQRLAVSTFREPAPTPLVLLTNWTTDLKK